MQTCYGCGQRYQDSFEHNISLEGYCSRECLDEDDKRLIQGNAIIDMAMRENPEAFSELNRLKLISTGLSVGLDTARMGVQFNRSTLKKEQD